jgi:putative tricarboxylic transport membrane protein
MFNYNFAELLSFANLFSICFGSIFGMVIGAMPGLGATVGAAMLLPLTYTMEPLPAVLLLVALYQGAEYGGSVASVVIGIPGTAAAVATVIDGNALAKKGFPGKSLGYSLYASTIGGFFGVFMLMSLTGPLTRLAIKLSDPEMFLIGIIGLLSVITLGSSDVYKSLLSIVLGLFMGTIGIDLFTGSFRYTFGNIYLSDGISMIALLAGLFAMGEVLNMVMGDLNKRYVTDTKNLRVKLSLKEFLEVKYTILTSAIIGTIFGIIPGLGAGPASWFAYMTAKQRSKNPETFGTGNPHGIAAPEAANNAVVGGALIPLLSLGIPGSATIAVVSSALVMQGIQPGPQVFSTNTELVYGIYWGLFFATIAMFIFGRYTTSLWASMLVCPNYILVPIVCTAALIGAYAVRHFFLDVWFAIVAAALVFFLKKIDFSVPAFVLAFVLARLIERSFRRSLMLTQGSFIVFFNRPICIIFWAIIAFMIFSGIRRKHKESQAQKISAIDA